MAAIHWLRDWRNQVVRGMIKNMKKQAKFYNTPDAPEPNRPIHMGAVGIIRNNGRVLLERSTDADR